MVLDTERGEPVAKEGWLRPKNHSPALGLVLLQPSGAPLPPLSAPTSLPWAQNDAKPDHGFEEAEDLKDPSDSGELLPCLNVCWLRCRCRRPSPR